MKRDAIMYRKEESITSRIYAKRFFCTLIALVVFVFSTLIFWQAFPSSRRNDFIIFYTTLMLILYLSLCSNRTVKVQFCTYGTRRFLKFIIIFMLPCLFIASLFCVNEVIILRLILSIILVSMVPGYLFIKLLKLNDLGNLEILLLSFCLSIPINATIFIIGMIFHLINQYLLIVYALLVIILFIVEMASLIHTPTHKEKYKSSSSPSFVFQPESFLLLWIFSLFVYALIINYPQTALKPADDLFGHWGLSNRIIAALQTNNYVIVDNELLYHMQWATIILLANLSTNIPDMAIFQSSMALLSIFNILSFYLVAKCYLKRIDVNTRTLTPLAALFWASFSGFGWIYCLIYFLDNATNLQGQYFNLLSKASTGTYLDTCYGNGPWVWLWYRPLTLGLTLFFTLMYLLSINNIDRKKFILILIILLITSNLAHFPESLIFSFYVFLLAILSFLGLKMGCHVQDASLSIGLSTLTTILFVSLQKVFVVGISLYLLIPLCIMGFFASFLAKRGKENFPLLLRVKSLISNRWLHVTIIVVYLSSVLVCLDIADTFSISSVNPFVVPLVFYPFLMGVTGILAIVALKNMPENNYVHLIPILILLLTGVCVGKTVSFINVNLFDTEYWERRIILLTYASLCLLAPIPFLKSYNLFRKGTGHPLRRSTIISLCIALLVLCGVSSTFLAIDYQAHLSEKNCLGLEYSNAIEALGQLEYNTNLLTVTERSMLVARCAPARWIPQAFRYHVLSAANPELPLSTLFQEGSHGALYLEKQDLEELHKKYGGSYIANHVLPLFYTSNSTYPLIIKFPESTPPRLRSTTVLVLSEETNKNYWFIYDALSQAQVSYTTSLFNDLKTISTADIVVTPSEYMALKLIELKKVFDLNYSFIVIFNVDGYGELSSILFDEPKMSIESENDTYVLATDQKFKNVSYILNVFNFTLIDESLMKPERLALLDESLDGWVCKGGGSGRISEPSLYLNSANSMVGNKSIAIKVGDGIYEQWIIYKEFSEKLELGNFDFVTFYWFGQNNGLRYVLQFETDESNYYWYEFTDNWYGWKKVYIPMWCEDGQYNFNNVTFAKSTRGHPTWSAIKRVVIKLSEANVNVPGMYKMDGFGFELSKYAVIHIRTHVKIDNFKIGIASNFINIEKTGLYETLLPYIVNGVNLYGNKTTLKISFTRINNETVISISCKLIPFDRFYESPRFTFEPFFPRVNVSRIDFANESLELPVQISVPPLKTSKEIVAYYDKDIPFIVKYFDEETKLNIIYLNFYPLENIRTTFNIIGKIIEYSRLFHHDTSPHNSPASKLPPENAVVFNRGILSGKVRVEPESLMLFNITKPVMLYYNNKNETLTDVTLVSPLYFSKASINADLLLINGGMGFYSNLYLKNATVTLSADENAILILQLKNGTRYITHSDQIIIYVDEANILARFPNIVLDGQAFLYDVYAYPNLNKIIRPDGVNYQFVGLAKFKIIIGDTYVITENFSFDGQFFPSKHIYTFNDFHTLLKTTIYAVLLAITTIIYASNMYLKRRINN